MGQLRLKKQWRFAFPCCSINCRLQRCHFPGRW